MSLADWEIRKWGAGKWKGKNCLGHRCCGALYHCWRVREGWRCVNCYAKAPKEIQDTARLCGCEGARVA